MTRFLLDANVVSEPHRPQPDPAVVAKLTMHQWTSALAAPVWYELVRGAEATPPGKRRSALDAFLGKLRGSTMPVLPYDVHAADVHARAESRLKRRGIVIQPVDGQIASIAVANELVLVTRNVRHFAQFPELKLENWFDR